MSQAIPNLRHLRAFCAVAACGSISRAAPQVYLSQPAISQAVAGLEHSLAAELFERRSAGMYATPAGRLFLARAQRALAHLATGVHEAARVGGRRAVVTTAGRERLLSTTQLRALVAVSSAHSFSMAARAVGVSQPSLHRAARDLEALLEITLFAKTRQGVSLSRAGELLARHARLAFAEIAQGFAEVAEAQGRKTGRIVIGSLPLARASLLPAAINALQATHPGVAVQVLGGPYVDLLHGLRHGELDILIGALRSPAPADDVVQEALFDDPLAVVARADHPLAARTRILPAQLAAYPWVVPARGAPTRQHFDGIFEAIGATPPPGLVESSSLVLIRGLLLGSNRLTLISAHQVRHEREQGLLVTLPVDMSRIGQPVGRPIGLTLRRDWHPTATQRRFLQLVRQVSGRGRQRPPVTPAY